MDLWDPYLAPEIFAIYSRRLFVRSSLKQNDLEILRGIENEVYPKTIVSICFFGVIL